MTGSKRVDDAELVELQVQLSRERMIAPMVAALLLDNLQEERVKTAKLVDENRMLRLYASAPLPGTKCGRCGKNRLQHRRGYLGKQPTNYWLCADGAPFVRELTPELQILVGDV